MGRDQNTITIDITHQKDPVLRETFLSDGEQRREDAKGIVRFCDYSPCGRGR